MARGIRVRRALTHSAGGGLLSWPTVRAVLGICALLLGGCVTTPLDIYMPQGGGELVDAPCASGPARTLSIQLPDAVELRITAAPAEVYPTAYVQIVLDVRIGVPVDTTVRLLTPDVVITSREFAGARSVPIVQIEDLDAQDGPRLAPLDPVPGTEHGAKYLGYQLSFVTYGPRAVTGIAAVSDFELQLPALDINGRTVAIASVAFVRQTLHGWRLACD
jgi:hypothetical protein